MAETVEGGVYLDPDNKTYHDANGRPVSEEKLSAYHEKTSKRQDQQAALAERTRQIQQQQRASLLAPGAPAAPLPADFPLRAQLMAAGFDTTQKVVLASDEQLGEVEGMRPATLKRIREVNAGV